MMRHIAAHLLERKNMLLKIRNLFCVLLIIQLLGCAQNAQISQIAYSEPPAPPAGMGLLYVYNIEMPNKLQMLPFVTIDQDLKEKPNGIGAASIKTGEYTWVHLAAGQHEAKFVNIQTVKLNFIIEPNKATYIEVARLSPELSSIRLVPEAEGKAKVQKMRYYAFDFNHGPCFVLTCPKRY
ncbi:MAG TPA: hypothetical protein PK129_03835 [Cellvibrionaceae bacterium]|nr:hypothetical protein [Cellvibrionaceae bacterium]